MWILSKMRFSNVTFWLKCGFLPHFHLQHNKWCLFSCSFFMFFFLECRLTKKCITAADYWFFFSISFLASFFVSRSSSFTVDTFFGFFVFFFRCKRLVNIGETQRVCEISNFHSRKYISTCCCYERSRLVLVVTKSQNRRCPQSWSACLNWRLCTLCSCYFRNLKKWIWRSCQIYANEEFLHNKLGCRRRARKLYCILQCILNCYSLPKSAYRSLQKARRPPKQRSTLG